jgi:hypothetical protein
MQCNAMPGRTKDKTPLKKTRRGVHVQQVQPPNNRTQPKKQTYGLPRGRRVGRPL